MDLERWRRPRQSPPSAHGLRELWESISLVVVPDGEVQPFGIVLLDPAVWQLARIQRQLWRVDGRELDFYRAVASRGIEDRGAPLETSISTPFPGLTFGAGAFSYFHAPRSERVPDRHQWIAGSLRPRTWMPTAALNLLAEGTRPKLYSKLLLDIALWRAATTELASHRPWHQPTQRVDQLKTGRSGSPMSGFGLCRK